MPKNLRQYTSRVASFALALLMLSGALSGPVFASGVDGSGLSTEDTNALIDDYPSYVPDNNSCTNSGSSTSSDTSATTKSSVSLPAGASIEQKIGQTLVVGFDATNTPKSVIQDVVSKYHIGGIFLTDSGGDAAGDGFTPTFFDKLNKDAGTDLMITSDEEGGQVVRFSYDDIKGGFPSAKQMGTMTPGSVKQIGQAVGSDLASDGVTVDLAPVLDLDDGKNAIAATDRSFGSDPQTVATQASAFASGLELSGVTPTYKHFPGFGGAGGGNTDSEPVTVPGSYDFNTNVSIYQSVLANDDQANVMLSNLFVPNFNNGKVATSMSPDAVNYLRKTLNFNGLIMTDSLSAFDQPSYQNAGKGMSIGAAVSAALQAGVDMPLFSLTATDKGTAEAKMDAIINNVKANVPTTVIEGADTAVIAAKNSTPSTDQGGSASGGCCQSGGSQLTGNGNGVAAYNFFVGKGMTPTGAAGIVGNLSEESGGVDPERLENHYSGEQPASSPEVQAVINNGNYGWGIAQWTPPSKIIDGSNPPTEVNTLSYQLTFLWKELTNSYKSTITEMDGDSTPEQAATDFLNGFERGDPASTRQTYARAYYNLATKNTPLPPNIPVSKNLGPGGGSTDSSGGTTTSSSGCGTSSGSGVYQDPLRDVEKSSGFSASRVDEGVDYTGSGPIYALGDGKVMYVEAGTNWPGGTFISYKLTDGPAKGDWVYIAENCKDIKVSVGDQVTSSSVLCTEQDASPYIETGWAVTQPEDLAAAHDAYTPTYPDGWSTAYGQNFSDLLVSLGAPAGTHDFAQQSGGKDLSGSLPTGWPTW